jgi:hypothetical protein
MHQIGGNGRQIVCESLDGNGRRKVPPPRVIQQTNRSFKENLLELERIRSRFFAQTHMARGMKIKCPLRTSSTISFWTATAHLPNHDS